ncbi:alanine--tRNA ligase [Periweissella beninensis]|uniref:Alanine--tRNA ligase n=1 Tax=Periweissella beninensis TaxID=504936 RepID=A0ABT0VF99_9LACO|nr:alanine--tRNA ligase [Periweissella beninensis]MBM7543550.1 alanyl-tRNA synthetase [Periweissella beninensis]MCM2436532.1 alanine--tRNA ligase [Periweissella beninensis]MCT4396249.1 alanine--tRNA ligase [Periweissella beninensis]
MKELTSAEIRSMFLKFFESKGHSIEPSQSLIPHDDPTLLWINSGVATLKKYFDGSVVPQNKRITNAQKSIRTNDIENVGHTARHHTLFEMMGNFSIGDYFKENAIPWAWELLTAKEWFAMDPEKLYVTVYPKDTDAKDIWLKTGVPLDHIFEVEDNFWDIGQGPSGPDTEIFYDRGVEFDNLAADDPENYPGGENERYLEIWNIVFSQFNHTPEDTYEELPHKNIDTGMGLERVVSVFQNAKTNFETDLFLPIIHTAEKLGSGVKYGDSAVTDVSFKVIADHARAVTFAISDGALPSNEGRGYVIRRLLRRAVLHGRKLGINGEFLTKLVPVVGKIMASYYPEVLENSDYIISVVAAEEKRFNETLTDGLKMLNEVISDTKAKNAKEISGLVAFKLYDTYGFPYELTEEYAQDEALTVDRTGFDVEMNEQRNRARAARSDNKSMGVQSKLLTDLHTPSKYVGWTELNVNKAKLLNIIENGELVKKATTGKVVQVIFDQTPFYAEMGGQIADRGTIENDNEIFGEVVDVQHAPNGQNLHTVKVLKELSIDTDYQLRVDQTFHAQVSKNHTATHMLDQALRNILGKHTSQAGSLVTPEYLRYDFSFNGAVPQKKLDEIEALINEKINASLPIEWIETDIESAQKLGAVAVFTEKYGETVRVVSIGDFNAEFDGGTHAKNTSELGLFKIVSESGIGAGIRRIEAVTGNAAFKLMKQHERMLVQVAQLTKAPQLTDTVSKVQMLQEQLKELERQNTSLATKLASQAANAIFDDVKTINEHTLIAAKIDVTGMDQLRAIADDWKSKEASDVLVLMAQTGAEKVNLIVAMSKTAVDKNLKAGDLVKAIAPIIGGNGGGRPDLAQAGGKNPSGINEALIAAADWLAR